MNKARFVQLGFLAFGLVLVSFFVRGFSSLVVARTTAIALAAPFIFAAAALVIYLFVWGLLDLTGIRSVE